MRVTLLILFLSLSTFAQAEKINVERIHSDGSNLWLKRIVEKVGNRLLRAIVVDRQDHEQHLFLTADDVTEAKRGLWVLRPGYFEAEI